jgi:hypothetical protein
VTQNKFRYLILSLIGVQNSTNEVTEMSFIISKFKIITQENGSRKQELQVSDDGILI